LVTVWAVVSSAHALYDYWSRSKNIRDEGRIELEISVL